MREMVGGSSRRDVGKVMDRFRSSTMFAWRIELELVDSGKWTVVEMSEGFE